MGSYPSKNAAICAIHEDLQRSSPTPPKSQLRPRGHDDPTYIPPSRESGRNLKDVAEVLNDITLASNSKSVTLVNPASTLTTFPRFLELPTEVQMLTFRQAVETAIGPVRKDPLFRDDLWYTETSLFSSGCTNYPHYMTYHNGGVGAVLAPSHSHRTTTQWVGIGSKAIIQDIMHTNRLSRQVVFEYWREAVGNCSKEYVNEDVRRKGMDADGRPINFWMMRALGRRELVLEVLVMFLRGMRDAGSGQSRLGDVAREEEGGKEARKAA